MIRSSALLVAVAIAMLVAGVAASSLVLIYVSIAVSALAAVVLCIGVLRRRSEIFGDAGPAPGGAYPHWPATDGADAPAMAGGQARARFAEPAPAGREFAGPEPARPESATTEETDGGLGWPRTDAPAPGADGRQLGGGPAGAEADDRDAGDAGPAREEPIEPEGHAAAKSHLAVPASAGMPERQLAMPGDRNESSGEDQVTPGADEQGAADAAPIVGTPADAPPGEDEPVEGTSAEDTSAEDTSAEGTPAEDTSAEDTPAESTPAEDTPAEGTPAEGEVTVVPGVARYHRRGCILIRFLSNGDLETVTRRTAEAGGSVPCKACQPDKPASDDASSPAQPERQA